MNVTLKIEKVDEVARLLKGIRDRGGDASRPLASFGGHMREMVLGHFEREQAADGTAWKKSKRAEREGGKTLFSSGRLAASVRGAGAVKVGKLEVRLGSNVKYAGIHQSGGVIRAKSGKYLAIPMRAARNKRPRDFEGTWFRRVRGRLWLFRKKGKRSPKIEALFLMLRSVTIPARPYLGFDPGSEDVLVELLVRHLGSAERQAFDFGHAGD